MTQTQCFPTLLAVSIGMAIGRVPPAIVQVRLPDGRYVSDFVRLFE